MNGVADVIDIQTRLVTCFVKKKAGYPSRPVVNVMPTSTSGRLRASSSSE